jgi:hypothetical protein
MFNVHQKSVETIHLRGLHNFYVQQKGEYNSLHTFNLRKAKGGKVNNGKKFGAGGL